MLQTGVFPEDGNFCLIDLVFHQLYDSEEFNIFFLEDVVLVEPIDSQKQKKEHGADCTDGLAENNHVFTSNKDEKIKIVNINVIFHYNDEKDCTEAKECRLLGDFDFDDIQSVKIVKNKDSSCCLYENGYVVQHPFSGSYLGQVSFDDEVLSQFQCIVAYNNLYILTREEEFYEKINSNSNSEFYA